MQFVACRLWDYVSQQLGQLSAGVGHSPLCRRPRKTKQQPSQTSASNDPDGTLLAGMPLVVVVVVVNGDGYF